MKKTILLLVVVSILLSACAAGGDATVIPPLLRVQYTAATQSWLNDMYDCAKENGLLLTAEQRSASDLEFGSADVLLRLGEPEELSGPAYQLGNEDILIVTHRESPIQNIDSAQVRALFMGQSDSEIQVWVYAAGDDVQQVFEAAVMDGSPVTSNARLAAGPQNMSDILNSQEKSLGILPAHWMAGSSRYVYTITGVPVLAMVPDQPEGAVQNLISCVQGKNGYSGN